MKAINSFKAFIFRYSKVKPRRFEVEVRPEEADVEGSGRRLLGR